MGSHKCDHCHNSKKKCKCTGTTACIDICDLKGDRGNVTSIIKLDISL